MIHGRPSALAAGGIGEGETMRMTSKKLACDVVNRKWSIHVVLADGVVVGFLEKGKNTRTEWHPWKAYKGYGASNQFLGAFYPEHGGKAAALNAIAVAIGG
jgi:hypothetical protein